MRNLFIAMLVVLFQFVGPADPSSWVARGNSIPEKKQCVTTKKEGLEQARKAFKRALEEGRLTKPGLLIEGVGTKWQ
jgi:hypothetical protein